jgi:TolA-binding protein
LLRHLVLLLLIAPIAVAQTTSKKRPPIRNKSGINVEYQQRLWNKDSKKIDTGYVAIKDAESNKIVIVQVEENEPDSSVFVGTYNIDLGNMKDYVPSVYVPTLEQIESNSKKQEFLQTVKDGKISRKPFILKKNGNQQILEAFDNRRQAKQALRKYRREKALAKSERLLKDRELVEEAQLESAANLALARRLVELKNLALERDQQRQKQLLVELAKMQKLRDAFSKLSSTQQSESIQKSTAAIQTAFKLFGESNFTEADAYFWSAVEADPNNNKTLYSYAVNLFRKEKYNAAINHFLMVKDEEGIDKTEKNYYLGASHYKLAELHFAEDLFNKVKNSANKGLAGSAAFYLGLIQYQRENFDTAKSEFEFVLDYSVDPALDKQAETYLERIQQDLQFIEATKKPYHLNVSAGLLQDSNILLQPDGTATSATAADEGGLRFQLMGSLEYKPILTREKEWSLKTTMAYFYSLDDEFSQADPLDIIVSAPFKKNSKAFDRSYRWELDPGIEVLYMDVDQEGSRENILNAGFVNWKNSFVMNDKWISNYNFQLYMNESEIDAATSDDDASSMKYTFTYNNIYFVDRTKGKTLVYDAGLSFNDADGKNYTYQRLDFAVNYILPITLWDLTLSTKLGYYIATYDSDDDREDKNLSLNMTFIRYLNDWLSMNVTVGYTDNASNIDTREYDKYSIGTNLSGKWNF